MELSSPNIKKVLIVFFFFFLFPEMELSTSNIKKSLIFFHKKTLLISSPKKTFLIFVKTEP